MPGEPRNKFGIEPADSVSLIGAPPTPLDVIVRVAPNAVFTLDGRFDVVIIFLTRRAEFEAMLPRILQALKRDSRLWTMYPDPRSLENADLSRERGWAGLVREGYSDVEHISFGDWFGIRWAATQPRFGRR
jgi:hypothetical protein